MAVRIIRIPRFIVEFIFQTNVQTSYPAILMAWSLLLMARTASATPVVQKGNVTETASKPEDAYHFGVQGIGVPVGCRPVINSFLGESSQYDQVGMSVSTTLMALVPTLLSFAPLPTAEIRSLLYVNTELALLTAAMTLGLYNKGTSTMKKRNSLTVKELIPSYVDIGILVRPSTNAGTQEPEVDNVSPAPGSCKQLRDFYLEQIPAPDLKQRDGNQAADWEEGKITLEKIQLMAIKGHTGRPRRIKIAVMIFFFCLLQITFFGILVRGLTMIDDIEFIWACHLESSSYFTWWLGGTAVGSGIIRTAYSSSSFVKNEIFHLSPLLNGQGEMLDPRGCVECSIDRKTPPEKDWPIVPLFKDVFNFFKWITYLGDSPITIRSAIRRLGSVLRTLGYNHSMVVVVRFPAESEKSHRNHPLYMIFFGYAQAVTLIFLTFLFGSAWNGTLFYTLAFVSGFLTVITGSRALSLLFCRWLEINLNTVVIECEDEDEKLGVKKILLSMPGVLVESTTGNYKYAGGYRFDTNTDIDGHDHKFPDLPADHGQPAVNDGQPATGHSNPYTDPNPQHRPRAHQWRAIGVGFGILAGVAVWILSTAIFYIASVPANEPFFPGIAEVQSDSSYLSSYFSPSISISVILGCALGFTFGVKVVSEFGLLVIGEDIPIDLASGPASGPTSA